MWPEATQRDRIWVMMPGCKLLTWKGDRRHTENWWQQFHPKHKLPSLHGYFIGNELVTINEGWPHINLTPWCSCLNKNLVTSKHCRGLAGRPSRDTAKPWSTGRGSRRDQSSLTDTRINLSTCWSCCELTLRTRMLPWCQCLSCLGEGVSLSLYSQFTGSAQALKEQLISSACTGAPQDTGSCRASAPAISITRSRQEQEKRKEKKSWYPVLRERGIHEVGT